jgi:hypothetical protein
MEESKFILGLVIGIIIGGGIMWVWSLITDIRMYWNLGKQVVTHVTKKGYHTKILNKLKKNKEDG